MNLRRFLRPVVVAAVFVVCGGLATLVGVLVSLPFHGTAHLVVWAAVATPVAVGIGYLLGRPVRR